MASFGSAPESVQKRALGDAFCAAHHIAEAGAAASDCTVEMFAYGRDDRPVLSRSSGIEELLVDTVERVLPDSSKVAEGVLYIMHWPDAAARVVPLHVGKASRYGRSGPRHEARAPVVLEHRRTCA